MTRGPVIEPHGHSLAGVRAGAGVYGYVGSGGCTQGGVAWSILA